MGLYEAVRRQIQEAIKIRERVDQGSLDADTAMRYLMQLGMNHQNADLFIRHKSLVKPPKWQFWKRPYEVPEGTEL